jgi:hypothetical protein
MSKTKNIGVSQVHDQAPEKRNLPAARIPAVDSGNGNKVLVL